MHLHPYSTDQGGNSEKPSAAKAILRTEATEQGALPPSTRRWGPKAALHLFLAVNPRLLCPGASRKLQEVSRCWTQGHMLRAAHWTQATGNTAPTLPLLKRPWCDELPADAHTLPHTQAVHSHNHFPSTPEGPADCLNFAQETRGRRPHPDILAPAAPLQIIDPIILFS